MDEKNGNQFEKPVVYKVYFKSNLVKGRGGGVTTYEYKDQFIKKIWNDKCICTKSGAFNFIEQTTSTNSYNRSKGPGSWFQYPTLIFRQVI